jgi:signal transduction histidine kinase
MLSKLLRHIPLPRSLRSQFILAVGSLEALMVIGGLITIHALRQSVTATRNLAEQRLVRMQDAQDLVQRTLLIEHHSERMLAAPGLEEMRAAYEEVIQEMGSVDHLVEQLSSSNEDASVLGLIQSGQLFRNTAHVVAGLREESLRASTQDSQPGYALPDPAPKDLNAKLRHFHMELHRHSIAMVRAAQELSTEFTRNYRDAVGQVATDSSRSEKWMLVLFFTSLVLAWMIYRLFLSRQILDRLQEVSNYLRQGDVAGRELPRVPVQGGDEIGEMARAVEQFLADRRRLAETNSELEAFSYSVSHDLQAPLRAIDGFSQLLLRRSADRLEEESKGYLETIHQNAIRMRDLIRDLLKFSRMSRTSMTLGRVDIAALARETFEEVRSPEPQRSIMLRMAELPPAKGDATLLRQVLVNLLSNAVKFTALQPEAIIEVSCQPQGPENIYCVKDNGVGFDMQYSGELFGVFQRMHGSEKFEGTGIGLAIVKRIILRHGGRVWAESAPGQGTRMFFSLPDAS